MATAVWTTIVDRAVGDPITESIWDDQIRDNGNSLAGSHRSLLTNGGFEVWQRGAGPFTATTNYTADRWRQDFAGFTVATTKETSIVDASGAASLKLVTTGSGSLLLYQDIENFAELRGRAVSVSLRMRQSVSSGCTVTIGDNVSGTVSAVSTTTGSFVTLTATYTINAAATSARVTISVSLAGTYYFDNAMLVIGPAPAPYQPLHPQEDLARCQRYYEVHGGTANGFPNYRCHPTNNTQIFYLPVSFAVRKGGTPTLTKNGTWAVTNCAQPTAFGASPEGYLLGAQATAAGAVMDFGPNSTDDTIVAEYNP